MPGVPLKDSMRAYGVKPGTINYNAPPPFGPQGAPADFYNVTRPGGQIPVAKPTATPLSPRPAPISGHAQTPLAPSTPTAPDLYRQGLVHSQQYDYGDDSYQGGLMTNFGAGINNMDRKYMPGVTVGGQFGKYNPAPGIAPQANGDIYSPAMRDMVNRGLNNARFGNARESMLYDISHPGNGVAGVRSPGSSSVSQSSAAPSAPAVNPAEFAKRQGLEFNPQTGVLAGNSQAAGMSARQLGDMRSGVNPFAPRASTSQLAQNLKNTQDARKAKATATPGQTPYQKRLAANEKSSQTAFERAFAVNNPAEAAQMAGIKARQQIASDDRQSRDSGLKQTLTSQERQVALRGGLDPNTGLPMTEPKGPLDAPNPSALAQLSPDELDVALKDYPQATRERLKEGVKQAQEPGFFSRLFGMSAMDPNVPADLYSPDHFLSRAAAAGVRTKPPVGLSKRAQELKQKNPSLFAPSAK